MNKLRTREELSELLSSKLNELMERDKVSLHVLSTRLGINKSTLHNWLNGVVPQPLLALLRVSDFFDITVDELCSNRNMINNGLNLREPLEIRFSIQIDYSSLQVRRQELPAGKSSK